MIKTTFITQSVPERHPALLYHPAGSSKGLLSFEILLATIKHLLRVSPVFETRISTVHWNVEKQRVYEPA